MPLRSVKMKRFILGFQRRVWCPKWTPLSSSWRMVTTAMARPSGAHRRVHASRRTPFRARISVVGSDQLAGAPGVMSSPAPVPATWAGARTAAEIDPVLGRVGGEADGPVIGWMTREVDRYGPVAPEV
ncbi:hypothetical protein CXY01_12580 [Cellulomonas xylanilytica]|uniref:Uncharacterized protein n=1 Tax=Cellulomonas xylanilytica TaxID=233583 RepID=A0A510V1K8_9CELL|nr:hypothetical protein CXY01_12580 [Cellulomonas xylanilytica]